MEEKIVRVHDDSDTPFSYGMKQWLACFDDKSKLDAHEFEIEWLTLAAKLMDKFGLPEEHNMLLVLRCFLLYTVKSSKSETKIFESDTNSHRQVEMSHKVISRSTATAKGHYCQTYEKFERVASKPSLRHRHLSYKNSSCKTVDLKANHRPFFTIYLPPPSCKETPKW